MRYTTFDGFIVTKLRAESKWIWKWDKWIEYPSLFCQRPKASEEDEDEPEGKESTTTSIFW